MRCGKPGFPFSETFIIDVLSEKFMFARETALNLVVVLLPLFLNKFFFWEGLLKTEWPEGTDIPHLAYATIGTDHHDITHELVRRSKI